MERRTKRLTATLLTTVIVVLLVGGISVLAFSGTVAADRHTPDDAPTYETSDGGVNFTINLPHQTDHYPGDHQVHSEQDGHNASIEYFSAGEAAFTEQGAEDGLWLDFIVVEANWIDYSECDATQNTKVFGIDRGNNNSGTNIDEDLIEHRKSSELFAGGLTVTFFDWGDLSGDPPYLAPGDAIVAAQGAGSNDGPCLKMTSEPGWYQMTGFANGTIANKCTEEGNAECEPDPKEWRGVNILSNYVYICACDSEQEARDQLGPPPNEEGSSDDGGSTPTPTESGGSDETPTPTEPPQDDTPTPTEPPQDDTPTPTEPPQDDSNNNDGGGNTQTPTDTAGAGGGGGNQPQQDRGTPTISDGPGFTPMAALLALLGAALLVLRRR